MKTSEIIMVFIIYVLMMIISYKPFKRMSDNKVLTFPLVATLFWIGIWFIATIIAIVEGYKKILKDN